MRFREPGRYDEAWLHTIFALIGESFADCGAEDVVHGVGISVKSGCCKVELWLSEPATEDQVLAIGRCYHAAIAECPGLWDRASKLMEFEDFGRRKVIVQLVGLKASKSTVGIFQ